MKWRLPHPLVTDALFTIQCQPKKKTGDENTPQNDSISPLTPCKPFFFPSSPDSLHCWYCVGRRPWFSVAGIILSLWVQKGESGTARDGLMVEWRPRGHKEQNSFDNGKNPSVSLSLHLTVSHHLATPLQVGVLSGIPERKVALSRVKENAKKSSSGKETEIEAKKEKRRTVLMKDWSSYRV